MVAATAPSFAQTVSPGAAAAAATAGPRAAAVTPTAASVTGPFTDTPAQRARACTVCHGDQGRSGPDGYVPRLAGKPMKIEVQRLPDYRWRELGFSQPHCPGEE